MRQPNRYVPEVPARPINEGSNDRRTGTPQEVPARPINEGWSDGRTGTSTSTRVPAPTKNEGCSGSRTGTPEMDRHARHCQAGRKATGAGSPLHNPVTTRPGRAVRLPLQTMSTRVLAGCIFVLLDRHDKASWERAYRLGGCTGTARSLSCSAAGAIVSVVKGEKLENSCVRSWSCSVKRRVVEIRITMCVWKYLTTCCCILARHLTSCNIENHGSLVNKK